MDSKDVRIASASYGKSGVKILYVKRDTPKHEIYEFEVNIELELDSRKDYIEGDNSLVIPTDTQKNTVYAIAQKFGVDCPEVFALRLSDHFVTRYTQVIAAKVKVESVNGWQRVKMSDKQHNHAFISAADGVRWCEVYQKRKEKPRVTAGICGMRILKTTQSAFVNFHHCEYTTLQDAFDRILSTVVQAEWVYTHLEGLDFCRAWLTVKDCILEKLAGPPETGLFSPSVQLTIYDTEKLVLFRVPQIQQISMALPNVHYVDVDMARFKSAGLHNTKNVYLPTDKPSGLIKATLERKPASKL